MINLVERLLSSCSINLRFSLCRCKQSCKWMISLIFVEDWSRQALVGYDVTSEIHVKFIVSLYACLFVSNGTPLIFMYPHTHILLHVGKSPRLHLSSSCFCCIAWKINLTILPMHSRRSCNTNCQSSSCKYNPRSECLIDVAAVHSMGSGDLLCNVGQGCYVWVTCYCWEGQPLKRHALFCIGWRKRKDTRSLVFVASAWVNFYIICYSSFHNWSAC